MRNITDCVNALLRLLYTDYEIMLGRKGVAVTLKLSIDDSTQPYKIVR